MRKGTDQSPDVSKLISPSLWNDPLCCLIHLLAARLMCISRRLPSGCPIAGLGGTFLTTSQNGCLGGVVTLSLPTPQLGQVPSSSSLLESSKNWACTTRRTCSMRRSYSCRPAFARLTFSASIRYTASYIFFFLLSAAPCAQISFIRRLIAPWMQARDSYSLMDVLRYSSSLTARACSSRRLMAQRPS